MTEFDFGNGIVLAHQHPNGGGWVADTARVDETAYVGENAQVFGYARVLDEAMIKDYAQVFDDATVFGNARLEDRSKVFGTAEVYGNARLFEDTQVYGMASIRGNVAIYGESHVYGYTTVSGNAELYRNARVFGMATVGANMVIISKVSKTPIFIRGTKCDITTHDDGIKAGCLYMTDKEWNNTTDEEILDEYGKKYADDLEIVRLLLKQRSKS